MAKIQPVVAEKNNFEKKGKKIFACETTSQDISPKKHETENIASS